jgi:membrane protease subunit HflC
MRFKILLFLLLIVGGILARMSLFTVDRTEFVYVTQFGRHVDTYDGAKADEAGLHLKWPWPVQSVQRLERRLQYFDLPGAELLTRDEAGKTIDKTLTIDAYVCWRVADRDAVDQFIRSVGTPEGARQVLSQRINSELGAAVSRMQLDDLIGVKPDKDDPQKKHVDVQRDRLRDHLLGIGAGRDQGKGLTAMAREEYGIEVVDVRLRRTSHPQAVREAIFDRIRSERQKKSTDYLSQGEQKASEIKSDSERRTSKILSEAGAEAVRLRGLADAEADTIRSEAQGKDPQFYAFLKKLEEYQRILGDNKSMLLLSTHRELFDVLFNPPSPNGTPTPPKPAAPNGTGPKDGGR